MNYKLVNAKKNVSILEQRIIGLKGKLELINDLEKKSNSDAENIKDMEDE